MREEKIMLDIEMTKKEEESIKAVVKSKPRLIVFIVSIVLSVALIASGIAVAVSQNSEPFSTSGIVVEGLSSYLDFGSSENYYYKFIPEETGYYRFESYLLDDVGCVIYDSDGDMVGFRHTGFDFTESLVEGKTYYIALYSTSGYSKTGRIRITAK